MITYKKEMEISDFQNGAGGLLEKQQRYTNKVSKEVSNMDYLFKLKYERLLDWLH